MGARWTEERGTKCRKVKHETAILLRTVRTDHFVRSSNNSRHRAIRLAVEVRGLHAFLAEQATRRVFIPASRGNTKRKGENMNPIEVRATSVDVVGPKVQGARRYVIFESRNGNWEIIMYETDDRRAKDVAKDHDNQCIIVTIDLPEIK